MSGLSGAVAIDAGNRHTCAVLGNGTARCWGYNLNGQLGDGTTTNSIAPVTVSGLTDAVAISATASFEHWCVVLADSTARCWGRNDSGQLGNGTTTDSNVPVPVLGN